MRVRGITTFGDIVLPELPENYYWTVTIGEFGFPNVRLKRAFKYSPFPKTLYLQMPVGEDSIEELVDRCSRAMANNINLRLRNKADWKRVNNPSVARSRDEEKFNESGCGQSWTHHHQGSPLMEFIIVSSRRATPAEKNAAKRQKQVDATQVDVDAFVARFDEDETAWFRLTDEAKLELFVAATNRMWVAENNATKEYE